MTVCCSAVRSQGSSSGGGARSRSSRAEFVLFSQMDGDPRAGDGETARYHNTPQTALGLVEGRPDFMGGVYDLNYDRSEMPRDFQILIN